ncbi:hypothetical protein J1N35_012750 [Gossypium stocksii]|uniref:Cation/H+ exchanger transmembrane domain-containing protein n=1 Tax=Gossypium stocksii TaxID=47602 RepID=A0A9D3W5C9_9ROSI|nr:hypothetical protein J1N35_012750 [Gossypium stocksii]
MMFWIIKKTPEGEPIEEVYIVAILTVAIGCAIFTHWTQQASLIGAFLFSLAVPDGPPLGSTLINKFECFINGIFLAVYITASAMRVNPRKMVSNPTRVKFSIISFFLTFLAKFISCFIASFVSFMPFRDSLAFGLIMSSKGVVESAFFSTFRDDWSAVVMAESLPPPYLNYENATYEFCFVLPPKVNSAGIWENVTNPSMIFSYSMPYLEMQFVMIFLVNYLVYTILRSIGITLFASQMFVC